MLDPYLSNDNIEFLEVYVFYYIKRYSHTSILQDVSWSVNKVAFFVIFHWGCLWTLFITSSSIRQMGCGLRWSARQIGHWHGSIVSVVEGWHTQHWLAALARSGWFCIMSWWMVIVIINMATAHARTIVARQAKIKRQRDCQISNQRSFQNDTHNIARFLGKSIYGTRNITWRLCWF